MRVPYKQLSIVLFAALTALVLSTFQAYGLSWDEPAQNLYGDYVLRFYTSFFEDHSAVKYVDLCYYGGFFELLTKLATFALPFGLYETRHLVSALFGVLGVFGCWKVTRELSSSGAAFWAALLLALSPSFYGHMFINSKDIPFAVLYVWALFYLVKLLKEFPGVSFKTAAMFGIMAGLTMAVRVGGFLLLCYFLLFLAVVLAHWLLKKRDAARSARPVVRKTLQIIIPTVLIAYAVMLLFWPYAVIKPFLRPFQALAWFSRDIAPSPMSYVPEYLGVKLPELHLVLVAVSVYLGVCALALKRGSENFATTVSYSLITFSVVFPVIYPIVTRPFLYDEARHFLFVVPPLCCLIGVTMNRLVEGVLRGPAVLRFLLVLPLAYLVLLGFVMIRLHPYEYAYYNSIAGGVTGAAPKGYETEYWATSYKEAVEKLEKYLRTRDGNEFEGRQYRILLGAAPVSASYYFPKNFVEVMNVAEADLYLSTTRYGLEPYDGVTVVEVGRFGVPFTIGKTLE